MSDWIEGAALYAVGGDARFRPLDGADANLVRAFLDAQTAEAVYALTGTEVPSVHKEANISHKRYDYGNQLIEACLLYTSPSPRDRQKSRMPSSA